jgi:hypothetical protein
MTDAEYEKLLKLYELAINEEHHFLDAHQNRIAFFSGILSALIAGTVAGLFHTSEWYHLAILCVGPVLIFVVSKIAIDGTFRLYQRFLEAVTIRAKIEQELGLTKKHSVNSNATNSYWQSEPIIPLRHIESRKDYKSSDSFIREHSRKGYHFWTIRLFRTFQCVSVLMFVGILSLTISKALICVG